MNASASMTSIPRAAAIAAAAALALSCACTPLSFVKRRLPPPQTVEEGVLFQFEAPSAHVVQLGGSWPENNWLRGQAESGSYLIGLMTDDDRDGIWTLVVDLAPGRYQYKYRIDEQNWKEDPNNPQRVDDGFGGFNSLLIVD
jgi:1,4-alpha-glucan branching enzyme